MGRAQRCWRDLQVSLEMGVWPHPAGLVLLRAPLPAAGLSQVLVSRPPRTPSPPRQGSLHSSTHPHLPSCPDQCWQLGEDVDRRTDRQTDSCRTPSFIAKCLCSADTGSLHPKPSPLQPWGCRQRFGLCRGRGAWCRAAPAAGRVAQPHRVWGRGQGAGGCSGTVGARRPRAGPGGCISCTGSSPTRPCTPGPAPQAASG